MKFLKVIYFHIYNSYFRDGNYKNDIPHLTAFGIVSVSLGLLVVSLGNMIFYAISDRKISSQGYLGLLLISLLLCYFLFLNKGVYNEIYEDFKDTKWDRTVVKIVAWAIVFIGFSSFVLSAFLFKSVPQ